jgi:hypothetical protein
MVNLIMLLVFQIVCHSVVKMAVNIELEITWNEEDMPMVKITVNTELEST